MIKGWSYFSELGEMVVPEGTIVKNEPMFFQATIEKARAEGGPITNAFLDACSKYISTTAEGLHVFLDSRIHMLMPGWYPCIPGWHHDDVERSRSDGQPNYHDASYAPFFMMALHGDAMCPTEFATGYFEYEEPALGRVIYQDLHPQVEQDVKDGALDLEKAKYDTVYQFDDRSWHQGTACRKGGWRWFGRLTFANPLTPANEIRTNANVYLVDPFKGW